MKKEILILVSLFTIIGIHGLRSQTFTGKPRYQIMTTRAGVFLGNIDVELFPNIAPKHVRNFDSLVNEKFFDTTAFHRVIPGFVIQGGDPNSRSGPQATWGYGDPSQVTVPAEFSAAKHIRGRLSAARDADTNSANSQFFICVASATSLDGQYSLYGKVTSGMNWVDTIVNSPRDANDCPYQKIEMFVTYTGSNDTVPASPVLLSPANYSSNMTFSKILSWSPISDAILYKLDVSTDSTFGSYYFTKQLGANLYSLTNLPAFTTFYWRVTTNNGGHFSTYSPTWRFTTQTGAAVLNSPANASTNALLNPILVWDTVSGADSYRLQLATNSSFSVASMVLDQSGITDTAFQVTALNPNTTYYWRIRSVNGIEEGAYSLKWSFTTGTTTGIINSVAGNIYKLEQNIPNPCRDLTSITYSIPSSERVIIKLFDILGREIRILENSYRQAGEHTIEVNLEKLKAGIYFYRIEAGSYSAAKKAKA